MANVINAQNGITQTADSTSALDIKTAGSIAISIGTGQTVSITTLAATNLTGTSLNVTTITATSGNITTLTGTSATITNILDGLGAVRNVPASSAKTTAYTLQTTDNGTFILTSSGTITVPNNTFAAGNAVSIFNNSANGISLTLSTSSAFIAGTDSNKTGMTLATRGVCTVLFVNPSLCVVSGNVT